MLLSYYMMVYFLLSLISEDKISVFYSTALNCSEKYESFLSKQSLDRGVTDQVLDLFQGTVSFVGVNRVVTEKIDLTYK